MRWRGRRADRRGLAIGVLLALSLGGCAEPAPPEAAPESSEMLDRITRPGDGAAVHLVRLVQRADSYSFDPATLTVAAGDVVRFVTSGSQPESVVFDPASASPEVAAFIRDHALDRGVLLTEPGQAHDVSFRDAPAGTYPFQSLPHAVQGMRGSVIVNP